VVKKLASFNRTPVWISPELVADLAPQGRDTTFSVEQQEEWAKSPDKLLAYRKRAEATMNHFFDLQIKDSDLQKASFEATRDGMKAIIKSHELADKLIPTFALGCRR
jgi:hypothetical protein